MGVGLHLLMVIVSVNFLAEASTGDADYETELLRQYLLNRGVPERLLELQRQRPLFTYKFPAPRLDETFAVPPSDPRYYYLPPSDRYENEDTLKRSSTLNRENKSSMRRPYQDNGGPQQQVIANLPDVGRAPEAETQDDANRNGAAMEPQWSRNEAAVEQQLSRSGAAVQPQWGVAVERTQPGFDRHSALHLAPTSVPISKVQVIKTPVGDFEATREDMIFMATVAGCSAAAVVIIAIIGFGWYRMSLRHQFTSSESAHPELWWGVEGDFRTLGRLHRRVKAAADVDYPAYGVTGPNKEISPTGDRKLAENAQMYHYQHQKQQIISMSNSRVNNDHRGSGSEAESDEENEEGDYTVYECPGLAATGEMEVKNPLFQDDPTPAGGPESTSQPQTNTKPQN
ncbi:uncharacterized protein LOC111047567 isoform X2 [Nilaparvata lugens]|uniref:uncharacterized protein LOC111047567 isoform X2 n=1 Tax=Nilaparvata lugens TaxID=108931 RepID=UPI00193EA1A2|nr:uncharacterized protein LOC111047567 isoform X2 [Nilaparvata lugens]